MQKKDLEVGVEYAIFFSPTVARRKYTWGSKPQKATLLALNGAVEDTFTIRQWDDKQDKPVEIQHTSSVKGILVKLDKPLTVEVPLVGDTHYSHGHKLVPKINHIGTRGYSRSRLFLSEDEEIGTEKRSYEQVVLESGGCFVSTWAEYEAKQKADKEYRLRAARERREEKEARERNHPLLLAEAKRLAEALRERGFEVLEARSNYLGPERLDSYEVMEGEQHLFALDLDWNHSEEVVQRVRIKGMDMEALVKLLGV